MNDAEQIISDKYLTDKDLSGRYAVSRATIWRWVKEGRIPSPHKLSPGCTRWRLSEVIEKLER